jgi:hypothetical protein
MRFEWIATGALTLAASLPSYASVVTFDEAGLAQPAASAPLIGSFYNGGGGGNLGIVFGSNALALAPGPTSSGNNGSSGVMWLNDRSVVSGTTITTVIDISAGFTSFFDFDWNGRNPFTVTLSNSGSQILQQTFNANSDFFPGWQSFSMTFAGTVTQVQIQGGSNYAYFDNLSFGNPAGGGGPGLPEPTSIALAGLALMVLGVTARKTRQN